MRILGVLAIIVAIALIALGKKEEKLAQQSSSIDPEGCITSLIGASVAIFSIIFGSIILVIGVLAFIAGLALTQRHFDLTENSVWKAEIRGVSDEELP